MNNSTQSKPTYNIQEGASLSDINRLTDQASQSSSAKVLNVKEEVESLVSSDQGFVRTLSNAINTLPSAGGVQDNPISQPSQSSQTVQPVESSQTFSVDEGSFTTSESLVDQTLGFQPATPSTDIEVDNNTSVSNLQGDFQSMKSELEGLAQRIKSELSAVTKAIGNVADVLPIPNPMESSSPIVGSHVTGSELLDVANQVADERAPEGVDIRFERLADGKFQQYINGSKGEIYSEQEIRGFINKGEGDNQSKNDKDDSDRTGYGNTDNKNADTADKNESNKASTPDNTQSIDESNAKTPKTSTDGFRVAIDLTGELVFARIGKFEIWDLISEHSGNTDGLTMKVSTSTVGGLSDPEFIDEYLIPDRVSDLIETEGDGDAKKQKSFKVPLAKKNDDGGWMPLTQGGYYPLIYVCINGVACLFPHKVI